MLAEVMGKCQTGSVNKEFQDDACRLPTTTIVKITAYIISLHHLYTSTSGLPSTEWVM